MISVLFATLDAGGNLPPALAVARAVVDAGGTVRFLASPTQRSRIEAAGFAVQIYSSARPIDATAPGSLASVSLRQARAFADRGAGRDVIAAFRAEPVDVVVIDCLLVGALDEAIAAGIPVVAHVHTLWSFFDKAFDGPLGMMVRMLGVHARTALNAPAMKIITVVPDLEGDLRGHGLHHVGPMEAIGAIDAAPAAPRILVSLSTATVPGQRQMLQRILDALAGIPAHVLVTTGPAIDQRGLRIPDGIEVQPLADHAREMPRTSLVITHGGHGTTARALAHGIPVLVLPAHPLTDQPSIAAAVARVAAGEALPRRARPAAIRAAVDRLLVDGPERASARALGHRLRAMHPDAQVVRLLQEAAASAETPI